MRLEDAPVLPDHVSDAPRELILRRVARAVREADLAIGVRDQRELEVVFRRELLAVFARVEADTDDLRVFPVVIAVEVPEPGTLDRSARGIGFRKKPEEDLLPAKIAETNRLPVMIFRFEVWCFLTTIQHSRRAPCDDFPNVTDYAPDSHAHIVDACPASTTGISGTPRPMTMNRDRPRRSLSKPRT